MQLWQQSRLLRTVVFGVEDFSYLPFESPACRMAAESLNSGASESGNGVSRDCRWSEEYERLPLKQRMKLLLARNSLPQTLPEVNSAVEQNSNSSGVINLVAVKEGDDSESLCPATFVGEEKIGNLPSQQPQTDELKDQVTEANQMNDTDIQDLVNVMENGSFQQQPLLSTNVVSSEVKFSDKSLSGSSGVDLAAFKIKTESPVDIFDDFDLVPLVDRQKMLLLRQKVRLINSSAKHPSQKNRSADAGNMTNKKNTGSSLDKEFSGSDAKIWKLPSTSNATMRNPAIKTEPLEENETIGNKTPAASLSSDLFVPVKYKDDTADDSDTDVLDHMFLGERMKLFSKMVKVPSLEIKRTKSSNKVVPSGLASQLIASEENDKGLRGLRPRKRKKTATDSVETALEEDAPGLLQVLIEEGISVNEIKLYGQAESDEALDELSSDDNFSELESVIAKLFSQRTSLLKLAPLRHTRGEKAGYCLACLFSLVEQAHYLNFRKWPVEWGWCRDLQSFIFIFERHNRIVLERPEYGYATYFFELVDSLSIDWQVKRLVIAMKLTSCSRITLIENKALEVGEDLTEGEAKVLMDYGWIPNTGLGTMLNYRDRVVHDRTGEKDTSEWRSKIGKLLVDGFNRGTIVSADPPKKAVEFNFIRSPEVKLELE